MRGERYSDQARLLRRRLSLKLLRDWLIYTVLFASAALVLNAMLVPRIADDIAVWMGWMGISWRCKSQARIPLKTKSAVKASSMR